MSDTFNDAAAATAAEIVASKAALAASDAAVTASLADWAADNLRTRQ